MPNRIFVALILISLLIPLGFLTGCGGCPWTRSTEVEIEPEISCLTAKIARPDGEYKGGCVNPQLLLTNNCDETLIIAASEDEFWEELILEPGEEDSRQIDLASAEMDGDDYIFSIPAILGEEEITLSFRTWLNKSFFK